MIVSAPSQLIGTTVLQGPGCSVVGFVDPGAGAACSAAGSVTSSVGGSVVSSVTGDALTSFAKDFSNTITHVLKLLATAWQAIPSPFTSSNGGAAQDGTTVWLGSELRWLVGAFLIVGTIVACIITMWHTSHGKRIGEDVERMSVALIRVLAVSGAGALFIGLFMSAGDGFATWILNQAGTSWSGGNAVSFASMATEDPALVITLGLLTAIAGFIQIVVVAGIAVVLPILVGLWPCSAALSATESGSAVWKRHTGWIVAASLFKPTAAIIYAVAFKMMSGSVSCPAGVTCDAQSVSELSLLFGLLLLVLAVFALPALMRLVVPAVAAVGGIAGGEAIGAAVSLATGAAMVAATGGAGAGAAVAGSSGASGSTGFGNSGGSGPGGPPGRGGTDAAPGSGGSEGADGATSGVPDGGSSSTGGSEPSGGGARPSGGGYQPSGGSETSSGAQGGQAVRMAGESTGKAFSFAGGAVPSDEAS